MFSVVQEEQGNIAQIHRLIANKIGRNWKEFARKLDVIEDEIDMYDFQFGTNYYIITLDVLSKFRQKRFFNVDDWLHQIRIALNRAKRNDISEVLDHYVVRLGGSACLTL